MEVPRSPPADAPRRRAAVACLVAAGVCLQLAPASLALTGTAQESVEDIMLVPYPDIRTATHCAKRVKSWSYSSGPGSALPHDPVTSTIENPALGCIRATFIASPTDCVPVDVRTWECTYHYELFLVMHGTLNWETHWYPYGDASGTDSGRTSGCPLWTQERWGPLHVKGTQSGRAVWTHHTVCKDQKVLFKLPEVHEHDCTPLLESAESMEEKHTDLALGAVTIVGNADLSTTGPKTSTGGVFSIRPFDLMACPMVCVRHAR